MIKSSAAALTPLTRVLAMINLAVALHHSAPHESVSLCEMALRAIEAQALHARTQSVANNVLGYALICRGDLARARQRLAVAGELALSHGQTLIALFAEYNQAVIDELQGNEDAALTRLDRLEAKAVATAAEELIGWITVRKAWLLLRAGYLRESEKIVSRSFGHHLPKTYRDAVDTLAALSMLSRHEYGPARRALRDLSRRYLARNDALDAMVMQLWLAALEHAGGRPRAARQAVEAAHRLGRYAGFGAAPNWWSAELVVSAVSLAHDGERYFFSELAPSADAHLVRAACRRVELAVADGGIRIDGARLPDEAWREGRTGSRVLRHMFQRLLERFPERLDREKLADTLWPESDGDCALRNLSAALNDLRRVLASVPGVRVVTETWTARHRDRRVRCHDTK